MFESLTSRLQSALERIGRKSSLREKDVQQGMREVRLALLEADVNFQVVKSFIKRVSEQAKGEEVLKSLSPGQQVVKIVHEELVHLLGDGAVPIEFSPHPPTPIMLCGLQGSGKTTTCGKLAVHLRERGHRPLLCAADVYRPAAIEQLQTVGGEIDVPVFTQPDEDPVAIARGAVAQAQREGKTVVILDTAGRLHIDEDMMRELEEMEASFEHVEVLLVVDAMTGRDAVSVAEEFSRRLELDGFILAKLDGDARGGAALSVREVTGRPIKFVGVGEKYDALEPFHPDRMASRILGMGDVLSLIEKAQQKVDQEKAQELAHKIVSDDFTLEDFRDHLRQVRRMGPVRQLLEMVPGFAAQGLMDEDFDERDLDHVEAIINSMTPQERHSPAILNASRKRRIAKGSGMRVQDVNVVLKQFQEARQMMKGMLGGGPPPTRQIKIKGLPQRPRF
ncbi:MAG: signal recognition particle protein [Armatimonadota bacterium]